MKRKQTKIHGLDAAYGSDRSVKKTYTLKLHDTGKSSIELRWDVGLPARVIVHRKNAVGRFDEQIPFQMPEGVIGIAIEVGKGRTIQILKMEVK
jgi:hypothetical protein